ncbi:MAG: bifunctional nuclease family protein [Tannerella sp.]|jgi:bifunctional DNase/RNase|nr:bifunctional nuclease family protein [Tannerella sp.]
MEDNKIRLKVIGLTNSQIQSGAYALILAEEGLRRIPIIVGMFEAQSIALALEGIKPPRPLTHDLFISFVQAANYTIDEVFIYGFEEGVFYSQIKITKDGETLCIDSRTSDAVAIALRAECEIYTTELIVLTCGIVIDENSSDNNEEETEGDSEIFTGNITIEDLNNPAKIKKILASMKKKELEERMTNAVAREDYEFAKIYKDELSRRDKGIK